MERFYLGVDVGGSKTLAMVADDRGHVLGQGLSGAGNHEVVGYAGLAAAVQEAVRLALEQAGKDRRQLAGAGFGVAGYDWPSELPDTLAAIKTLGLTCPIKVVNDTVIGLVAGAREGWGVVIVAGSGCNCWGRSRDGREGRVTGCGGRFGEGAGAGEIMGKVVQQVTYAHFLRGPQTHLTQLLIQDCGTGNAAELVERLSLDAYWPSHTLTPRVFELATEGDAVALQVLEWAGAELGALACCVIRQLQISQEAFDVVLSGSTFKGGRLLTEPMQRAIWAEAPQARFTRLTAPPVVGAVLLAMEAAGIRLSREIYEAFS